MSIGRNIRTTVLAALVVSAAAAFAALAGSGFEGVWAVKDSDGKPFDITLSADGKATATRSKDMTGTWTEEGGAAVIKWDTGWTTKIMKQGDGYKKEAFKEDGSPANTSDAEKK